LDRSRSSRASGELHERHLGLDHPELGEVTPRLGFLGAEGGAEAIDPAEGHAGRLEIQLARLGQIGGTTEVIRLEQRGSALARGGSQDRRVDVDVSALVEVVPAGVDNLVPHAQDGAGRAGAQVQVALIEQELDAVLLGLNRILARFVDHRQRFQGQLVASRGTLVLADGAGHRERRFEG
jgi:hypothetical protein